MPAVQRKGDANGAGGVATGGVGSVRANGRAIVIPGISVTAHPCCGSPGCAPHCAATTAGGSGSVRAGGAAIIRTGTDVDTCGHPRSGGSPNVRVA